MEQTSLDVGERSRLEWRHLAALRQTTTTRSSRVAVFLVVFSVFDVGDDDVTYCSVGVECDCCGYCVDNHGWHQLSSMTSSRVNQPPCLRVTESNSLAIRDEAHRGTFFLINHNRRLLGLSYNVDVMTTDCTRLLPMRALVKASVIIWISNILDFWRQNQRIVYVKHELATNVGE